MSKLSIIIPVYNSEKYLRRCIDSVTKQDPSAARAAKILCGLLLMMGPPTIRLKL